MDIKKAMRQRMESEFHRKVGELIPPLGRFVEAVVGGIRVDTREYEHDSGTYRESRSFYLNNVPPFTVTVEARSR